jgi:hypothetical protein
MNVLGDDPKAIAQMKSTYLESLKRLDVDGNFSFKLMGNKVRNDPKVKRILTTLFSSDELDELGRVLELGEKMGDPILNYSGTARTGQFLDAVKQPIQDPIVSGARNYLKRSAEHGKSVPPQVPGNMLPSLKNVIPMRKAGQVKVDALKAPIDAASSQEAKIKALLQTYKQFAKPKDENDLVSEKDAQDQFIKGN